MSLLTSAMVERAHAAFWASQHIGEDVERSCAEALEAALRVAGFTQEWRACANDGIGEPADCGLEASSRAGAEDDLAGLLNDDPPYERGWIERRLVGPWIPLEGE